LSPNDALGYSYSIWDIGVKGNVRINRNTGELVFVDVGTLSRSRTRFNTLDEAASADTPFKDKFKGMKDGFELLRSMIKEKVQAAQTEAETTRRLIEGEPSSKETTRIKELPVVQNEPLTKIAEAVGQRIEGETIQSENELGYVVTSTANVWYKLPNGKYLYLGNQFDSPTGVLENLKIAKSQTAEASKTTGEVAGTTVVEKPTTIFDVPKGSRIRLVTARNQDLEVTVEGIDESGRPLLSIMGAQPQPIEPSRIAGFEVLELGTGLPLKALASKSSKISAHAVEDVSGIDSSYKNSVIIAIAALIVLSIGALLWPRIPPHQPPSNSAEIELEKLDSHIKKLKEMTKKLKEE
jgi:hypothetical protein